ncbi:MAG: putative DNA-binding domain-containing protein [Myxococcales bacterium]|nr:putative DNA-binding domain-containing protein [Myxococcales bacterium]
MQLAEFQKRFLAGLYAPKLAWESLEPLIDSGGRAGLEIYRRNLIFALVGALEETYRATAGVLGRENFRFLGKRYLHAHPSTDVDLTRFGARFPDFLATCAEVDAHPWLRDLARLEQAWSRTARSEPGDAISRKRIEPLLTTDPSACVARLERSVRVLRLEFDVLACWREFGESGQVSNAPTRRTNWILTCLKGRAPRASELEPVLGQVLVGLAAGNTLGQLANQPPVRDNPAVLRDALGSAIDAGWIAGLGPPANPDSA